MQGCVSPVLFAGHAHTSAMRPCQLHFSFWGSAGTDVGVSGGKEWVLVWVSMGKGVGVHEVSVEVLALKEGCP